MNIFLLLLSCNNKKLNDPDSNQPAASMESEEDTVDVPTAEPSTDDEEQVTEDESEEIPSREGWTLVWNDEFSDLEIDSTKWYLKSTVQVVETTNFNTTLTFYKRPR